MEGIVRPSSITAEELLLRLKKATAELTLLRKQNSELVQKNAANESYINELSLKLAKREVNENRLLNLNKQIENLTDKVRNQRRYINQINNGN